MTKFSVVIPAFNEERYIETTLLCLFAAAKNYQLSAVEILVVDNLSQDQTPVIVDNYRKSERQLRLLKCERPGAAFARNWGAENAKGETLLFLDADTHVPPETFIELDAHIQAGYIGGISSYESLEPGIRSRFWWTYWNMIRRLPLPHAKAMSAFLFCTREAFYELGPFDERYKLGEEWPIMSGLYKRYRSRFVYDRTLKVKSSSRRMKFQRFGYLRTFIRWNWALVNLASRESYLPIR